jgi:hypothetical protein
MPQLCQQAREKVLMMKLFPKIATYSENARWQVASINIPKFIQKK